MKQTENLTPETGTLSQDEHVLHYDLGAIKRNTPVEFRILIKDAQHQSTKYGCGSCTTGSTVQQGNDILMTVRYDAKSPGAFTKAVAEIFTDGTQQSIKFKGITK